MFKSTASVKRNFKAVICILAAMMIFVASFPLVAHASGETVIVGANPSFGISKSGSVYYGFAYDYLENMKRLTGHNYVYAYGTPDELFEMLLERKIDVIPCVTESEIATYSGQTDSADAVTTTSLSLMTKYCGIYVSANGSAKDITYGDMQTLSNMKIGYLAEDAERYFDHGRFKLSEMDSAAFILYNTESQMKADLAAGKLGAVVKDCYRTWENEKLVYIFSEEECFFAVSGSDADLCSALNSAVAGISINEPSFVSETYEKNLSRYGAQIPALTQGEKEVLNKKKKLNIAYNTESSIIEHRSGGNISGLNAEMFSKLEKISGLKFNVIFCDNLSDCMEKLSGGEADAMFGGVNYGSMSAYSEYCLTRPLTKSPMAIAGKDSINLTGSLKIAVPFYGDDITGYARQIYPGATFLPYENVRACMEAVNAGSADIACAGAYDIIYYINNGYDRLKITDVLSDYHCERFAVSSKNSALFSLLDKCMAQIGMAEVMTTSYDSMIAYTNETNSVGRFVEKYVGIFIAVIVILFVIIAALLVSIYLRTKRNDDIDRLTGGRSKRKFIEDSQRAIKKSSPEKWALILFDIDKFKFINDRYGFDEGNRMLERLYKTVGDHLADDEVYARISDDNFALTVHNASDSELSAKMQNIFAEFERRNALFVKYSVLFSAGICRLGQCTEKNGTVDFNTALDRCTIAKKTLKGMHSHSIAFYDGKIRDKALREKDYESVMPTALANHEFQCYLQPKYGLKSRHIEGAEALIRWNSKEFGFVYPNDFIPLSEKNGFVVELDFFILEEVCKTMRRWIDEGKTPVVVSVNQSRLHLNYDDYIWRLREIVDKYEIPYRYIELELTETVFTENADLLLKIMQKLHDIGFKLSIDDFGSGYSSLNMLKDIPADVVKIDREFFNGTVNSQKGRAVISTVVDLAKNLDMEVISEGVETIDQVNFLTEIDCAMVQGYYFAKPMTISSFDELWDKDLAERAAEEKKKEIDAETTGVTDADAKPAAITSAAAAEPAHDATEKEKK